jgi:hypothetical protein
MIIDNQEENTKTFKNQTFAQWHAKYFNRHKLYVKNEAIVINPFYTKHPLDLKNSLDDCIKVSFHPINCNNLKSVIDHELGHSLCNEFIQDNSILLPEFKKFYDSLSSKDIKNELSQYATVDVHEFFAEAWSEYLNNPNCRPIAKKIGDMIKKNID